MREVDVLVVGAGPAGLSAAIVLAGQGLRTLVCEQKRLPVNKACGEGVMPTGVAHLDQLGLKKYLCAHNVRPFVGVRYYGPDGRSASGRFREGPGWGIRRTDLSAALGQRAAELPQLEIREGAPVRHIQRDERRLTVQVGQEPIQARLLVGADGLNSRVRRWAGLESKVPNGQRWGVRQHFALVPWSEYVEVYWADGLEAYVTPCANRVVGVALLWDRRRRPVVPGGPALFPRLLAAFPELEKRLQHAQPCDAPLAIGPLERRVKNVVGDGLLLIGDAAGYLDAITGEGISLATAAALALRETVTPLLQAYNRDGAWLRAQDLAAFAQAHQAIVKPYYRMTRLVLFLSRHPMLARKTIHVLARRPGLFQHLLSANMGLAPLWPGFINLAGLLRKPARFGNWSYPIGEEEIQ